MMLADGGETLRETVTWKSEEMGGVIMTSGWEISQDHVQWKAFILAALNLPVLVTEG
jgi:hypothetical protein